MEKGRLMDKLNKTYQDFWLWIVNLTDRKAVNLSKGDLKVEDASKSNDKIVLRVRSTRPFLINGLTGRRRDSTRTDYDVAIEFVQYVYFDEQQGCFKAIKSTVRLLYMENYKIVKIHQERFGKPGKIYSGIHFDLVSQDSNNTDGYDHPIFHASFDLTCIDPQRAGRGNYEKPSLGRFDFPRIPTAPMDLGAVIFSILRDHLPEKVIRGWPQKMSDVIAELPRYPRGTLDMCLKEDIDLSNRDWYKLDGQRNST
jgi:hypothetical protein